MKLGRSFRALLTANIAANAGDGLMYTALPLLALSIHNDPLTASAPRIAAQVAPLVSGVFIGLLVDRYRRKFILLNSNIIRLSIISSFAVVVTLGNATVILIILVAIIWGIFENSFDAASMVTVPDHVKTSQLELANGQLSAGQRVAQGFVAVPIAAAAFAILKPLPFLVGVVLLVISILAVLLIQRQPRCERSSQDDESMTAWHALTRGFVLVWRTRALRSVIGLNISLLTLLQFSQGALVFYAVSVLHTPEAAYGLVVTGAAAGAIVGSVTAGLVVARFSPRSTALLSGIALGVGLFALGLLPATPWSSIPLAAILLLVSVGASWWNVIIVSFQQRTIARRSLGRVHGVVSTAIGVLSPVATLLGALASRWEPRVPWLAGGAGIVLLSILSSSRLRMINTSLRSRGETFSHPADETLRGGES